MNANRTTEGNMDKGTRVLNAYTHEAHLGTANVLCVDYGVVAVPDAFNATNRTNLVHQWNGDAMSHNNWWRWVDRQLIDLL